MKRVLVIDDNTDILELVSIIFKRNGYEIVTSPKGEETFSHVETFSPQIILLDVFLAGIDGREICKELKSNPLTKNIPIIMFSAHSKAEEILNVCTADDFIAKPFDINEIGRAHV